MTHDAEDQKDEQRCDHCGKYTHELKEIDICDTGEVNFIECEGCHKNTCDCCLVVTDQNHYLCWHCILVGDIQLLEKQVIASSKTETALVEALRFYENEANYIIHDGETGFAVGNILRQHNRYMNVHLDKGSKAKSALALVKETQGQVPENHKDVHEKGLPKEASNVHGRNHAAPNQPQESE